MKVNEIFDSFQGEGVYYKDISVELVKEAILQHMKLHNTNLLVITGGEPLLQYDELKELVESLNCNIQIETNGSIFRIPLTDVTYVVSPKKKIKEVFEFYKDYSKAYFKFVIKDGFDLHMIKQLLKTYNYNKTVWLQPEYSNAEEITSLILNKNLPFDYRISGQLHKYLKQE